MSSDPAIPPLAVDDGPRKLPDLNTTLLDAAQVEQLLRDIELCAEITGIIPKFATRNNVPDTAGVTLAQARRLLATRGVRGLQLRYRYEGGDWWDTLTPVGDQFCLVRIRHDFTTDGVASWEPGGAGTLEGISGVPAADRKLA